jgi:hypothetical protein
MKHLPYVKSHDVKVRRPALFRAMRGVAAGGSKTGVDMLRSLKLLAILLATAAPASGQRVGERGFKAIAEASSTTVTEKTISFCSANDIPRFSQLLAGTTASIIYPSQNITA